MKPLRTQTATEHKKLKSFTALSARFIDVFNYVTPGPHPYQVIGNLGSATVWHFLLRKRIVSSTFLSVDSVRFFPRVGHGVGQTQKRREHLKEQKSQLDCPLLFFLQVAVYHRGK